MTDTSKTGTPNQNKAVMPMPEVTNLSGLFDEMQALLAVMPGVTYDTGKQLPTDDEVEAMFDNMPV